MDSCNSLVVLNDIPQMNLCQVCPEPGHCCQGFTLNIHEAAFWLADDEVTAKKRTEKFLKDNNLPFEISGTVEKTYLDAESGRRYSVWIFSCPKLTIDGKCSIYKTRPDVCRRYIPTTGDLCCFKKY